ncbi:hypothetical protein ACOTTU_19260 [Roseobacter sp. EG26]|uniref:hypothetical protein n=1 Tax=Roseobacter sp. EG26 TaxID=3412477 RepID=UPI003CE5A19E
MVEEHILKLAPDFLRYWVFNVAGADNQARTAQKIGCSESVLSLWLNGQRAPRHGNLCLIAAFLFSDDKVARDKKAYVAKEGKFIAAVMFLRRCDSGEVSIDDNPPEFAYLFLVAQGLIQGNGRPAQNEPYADLPDNQSATQTSKAKVPTRNWAPDLVELSGVGWTQMPSDSDDFELAIELTCDFFREIIGTREFRYGAQVASFKVTPTNFDFKKIYKNSRGEIPEYVRYLKNGHWYVEGPIDRHGLLRGNALSDAICIVNPIYEGQASLEVDAYVERIDLDVKSINTRTNISEEMSADQRTQLIDHMVCILINKRNEIDERGIVLSSAKVEK